MASNYIQTAEVLNVVCLRGEVEILKSKLKFSEGQLAELERDIIEQLEDGAKPEKGCPACFVKEIKLPKRPAYKEWIEQTFPEELPAIIAATEQKFKKVLEVAPID